MTYAAPAGRALIDRADPTLRKTIRNHGLGHVLQIVANRKVHTTAGPVRVTGYPT